MYEEKIELPEKAIEALRSGSKIEAIKIVHIQHGIGRKEAKETVEEFLEQNPALKSQLKSLRQEKTKSVVIMLIMIIALGLFLYYYLFIKSRG